MIEELKILSVSTGIVIDRERKLFDVKPFFKIPNFPGPAPFSVGVSITYTENAPEFIVRCDILDSDGVQLDEKIHETTADVMRYFYEEESPVRQGLDIWITPSNHNIPCPGLYTIQALIVTDKSTVVDKMETTVLVSSSWSELR